MTQYKLTYFEGHILAEVIRQILLHVGEPFEEVRLTHSDNDWTPEKKAKLNLEWDALPILEIDGVQRAQSFAIYRYLAKKYNLIGDNEDDEFRCDEIVEALRDYRSKVTPLYMANRSADPSEIEKAKQTFVEVDTAFYLGTLNKILENKGNIWCVGNKLTYADLVLVHFVINIESYFELKLTNGFPAIEKLILAVLNNKTKLN